MPETIEQLRAENAKLRAENAKLRAENQRLGGATTMMGCKACGNGVRPRYAVHGMCGDCAAKRIAELEAAATALLPYMQEDGMEGETEFERDVIALAALLDNQRLVALEREVKKP